MKKELTADRLREVLDYPSETGVFTWRVQVCSQAPVGAVAGTLSDSGYWRIRIDSKFYYAHRLAWLYVKGLWPRCEIDHKNRVKTDNRIANLREATRAENEQNKSLQTNNKSGYRGVCWLQKRLAWAAQISVNGKRKHLGYFATPEAAYEAYKSAATRAHTHNPTVGGQLAQHAPSESA